MAYAFAAKPKNSIPLIFSRGLRSFAWSPLIHWESTFVICVRTGQGVLFHLWKPNCSDSLCRKVISLHWMVFAPLFPKPSYVSKLSYERLFFLPVSSLPLPGLLHCQKFEAPQRMGPVMEKMHVLFLILKGKYSVIHCYM